MMVMVVMALEWWRRNYLMRRLFQKVATTEDECGKQFCNTFRSNVGIIKEPHVTKHFKVFSTSSYLNLLIHTVLSRL